MTLTRQTVPDSTDRVFSAWSAYTIDFCKPSTSYHDSGPTRSAIPTAFFIPVRCQDRAQIRVRNELLTRVCMAPYRPNIWIRGSGIVGYINPLLEVKKGFLPVLPKYS